MGSLIRFLVGMDIFGRPIGVNLHRAGSYQTKFGALVSLACYVLIFYNTVDLVTGFINRDRQSDTITWTDLSDESEEVMSFDDGEFYFDMLYTTGLPDLNA